MARPVYQPILFTYEKRKYPFKEFIKDFFKGALNILPTGLIACLILGMQYLIKEGNILDTIIHGLAQLTANASPFGAALIMCAFVLIVEVALPGTMVKALTILHPSSYRSASSPAFHGRARASSLPLATRSEHDLPDG